MWWTAFEPSVVLEDAQTVLRNQLIQLRTEIQRTDGLDRDELLAVLSTLEISCDNPKDTGIQRNKRLDRTIRSNIHQIIGALEGLAALLEDDVREPGRKTLNDWEKRVLSAENRLGRFLGSKGIRRYMGLKDGNVDLMDVMDRGNILLVNLGESDFLDRKAAVVFASLLVYEFKHTALRRALRAQVHGKRASLYPLYLDEFQNYITEDLTEMLDQVLKGGLHVVMAHQHLGHFADNPKLKKSIFTNARIRAVFGGLDFEDSCVLGNEMFLPDLNTRQIKKAYYHTTHLYTEETRTARSRAETRGSSVASGISWGTGSATGASAVQGTGSASSTPGVLGALTVEGWFTDTSSSSDVSSHSRSDFSATSEIRAASESQTIGESLFPVWVPIPLQELGSESEWSREEKLSKVAQLLSEQMQQHCFIKLDREKTQPMWVPDVKDAGLSPKFLLDYQREVYRAQGALPAISVDRLLEESHQKFLASANTVEVPIANHRKRLAVESSISAWRTGSNVPSEPSTRPEPTEQARSDRGPATDFEKHAKIAQVVATYGDAWTSDENLIEICEKLDKEGVPVPKTWPLDRDHPARHWLPALQHRRIELKKAIRYSKSRSPNQAEKL